MKKQFTIRQLLVMTALVGVALTLAGFVLAAIRYSQGYIVDTNDLIGSELNFEEFYFQQKHLGAVLKSDKFTLNGKELNSLAQHWKGKSGLTTEQHEQIFWASTEAEYVARISNGKTMTNSAHVSELNGRAYIIFYVFCPTGDVYDFLIEADKILLPSRLSELKEWINKNQNGE